MYYLSTSTHLNNWIFTSDELNRIHRLRYQKMRLLLKNPKSNDGDEMETSMGENNNIEKIPRSFACLIPKSCNISSDTRNKEKRSDDDINLDIELENRMKEEGNDDYLSIEEEEIIRKHYEIMVQDSCIHLFRTTDKVKASAVMLYKRFYLSNSVMEFHPAFIVPTVIYIAAKVEEQYINVDTISELLKIDHKVVIENEMIVLQGVRFQLIIYHPFRSLYGFIEDARMLSKSQGKNLKIDTLQKLHANACEIVNKMMLTNIPLTYNPALVALVALRQAMKAVVDDCSSHFDINDYLKSHKFAPANIQKTLETLDEIEINFEKESHKIVDTSLVKLLYKRLLKFHPVYANSIKEGKEPKKKKQKKDKKEKKE